ncbi:TIGR02234 family membrane protein [Rhodococcus rhodnii]|uniref:TIGR02234 family membrane protein n=2 Tax=Rhodococcus rhodnii TaxID=38312 RepID=R7WTJ2_9NOCA|nr:TIGR02234 family membrane protein [Rhodococcus rhodnii]EOM78568.1 hypothetical protein Rrhod_0106 [Rhodococcus rhodnii LMG 5362]TXG91353.1 TIGR02234 family membrane protein [Rhodococcus rhodnii]
MTTEPEPAGTARADQQEAPAPARRSRSPRAIAVALLALAAAVLWASSRLTWVVVESSDGLGADRTTDVLGATWSPTSTPLALALVAAIAAVFAVRGRLVALVAVVVAIVAVGSAIGPVRLLVDGADGDRAGSIAGLPTRAVVTAVSVQPAGAVVAVVGSVVALVAAVALLRAPAGGGLSSKYDAPATRRAKAVSEAEGDEVTERMLWDALDAGEDPTSGDAGRDRGEDPTR